MIAKARTEFPFKVFTKQFKQNYSFQESDWSLFPGSSQDYWTHEFPMNVTSLYAEDPMVL